MPTKLERGRGQNRSEYVFWGELRGNGKYSSGEPRKYGALNLKLLFERHRNSIEHLNYLIVPIL